MSAPHPTHRPEPEEDLMVGVRVRVGPRLRGKVDSNPHLTAGANRGDTNADMLLLGAIVLRSEATRNRRVLLGQRIGLNL